MSVIPFPRAQRVAIANAGDVGEIEALICGIAGMICATGGMVAIAGHDIHATAIETRIALLSEMYAEGEVVIGYLDARSDETINIAIEKLTLPPQGREGWRADVFVADEDGHASLGALSAPDARTLCKDLLDGVSDGFTRPLDSAGAALLKLARR